MGSVVVAEVIDKGPDEVGIGRTAAKVVPGGLGRNATVIAQFSHGVALRRGVITLIVINHIVPVIGRSSEVHRKGHASLVILDIYRPRSDAMLGVLVVVHVLGHRCRSAAEGVMPRVRLIGAIQATIGHITVERAHELERLTLPPEGRQERVHMAGKTRRVGLGDGQTRSIDLCQTLGDGIEPPFEAGVITIKRKLPIRRIGQQRRETVITGHDGITASRTPIDLQSVIGRDIAQRSR